MKLKIIGIILVILVVIISVNSYLNTPRVRTISVNVTYAEVIQVPVEVSYQEVVEKTIYETIIGCPMGCYGKITDEGIFSSSIKFSGVSVISYVPTGSTDLWGNVVYTVTFNEGFNSVIYYDINSIEVLSSGETYKEQKPKKMTVTETRTRTEYQNQTVRKSEIRSFQFVKTRYEWIREGITQNERAFIHEKLAKDYKTIISIEILPRNK